MTESNRPVQKYKKDPTAKLDYSIDWSDWLESADTISVSAWTVPTGITQVAASKDDETTTIWLSGGTSGVTYEIKNKVTTGDGRIDTRSFLVTVIER